MLSKVKNTALYSYYLSHLWKRTQSANKQKAAILMYHGITDQNINLWTQVHIENFKVQMEYIKSQYNPISLSELILMRKEKRVITDFPVCVTFDDGFQNNFTTAYPILKEFRIPATIFVTTSFVDKTGKYEGYIWTDYILMLLIESSKKNFSDTLVGIENESLDTLDVKIQIKEKITSYLKSKSSEEKDRYIAKLKEKLEVTEVSHSHPVCSSMSWEELKKISDDPLITIGAHTVNHPILSQIDDTEIEKEIIGSKMILEQKLDKEITLFAYPNGRKQDYNQKAIDTAQNHFDAAVTTIDQLSPYSDDHHQLKRIPVGNDTKLWQFKLLLAGVYESLNSGSSK